MELVVESHYFAPVILYKKLAEISDIKFDLYENWQKMSFRNRCVVVGADGPINLSIPLLDGRDQRKPMKEVLIDNRKPWQSQHFKTILSCYNRSPWFAFFCDELEVLYRQPFELLADWNRTCFEWALSKLGMIVRVEHTQSWQPSYDEKNYLDWRNQMMPKSIQTNFPQPVFYHQVFEERIGFVPHASILDLLFCEGKNARQVLLKA